MNIEFFILKLLALIRAFFYLYITLEAVLLAYLYWNAYKKYKTTPIIKGLQLLLFSIGISFFYMCLIAIMSFIDSKNILYDYMITLIPLFSLPLMYSLNNFREQSTKEMKNDGKKLNKHYKLK
jgi:ABC-type uncharacterized transport system permease subunit